MFNADEINLKIDLMINYLIRTKENIKQGHITSAYYSTITILDDAARIFVEIENYKKEIEEWEKNNLPEYTYRIYAKQTGADYGLYKAHNEKEAKDKMFDDAGTPTNEREYDNFIAVIPTGEYGDNK